MAVPSKVRQESLLGRGNGTSKGVGMEKYSRSEGRLREA